MTAKKDVLAPAPKKGDLLAVYKPEFSAFGATDPEKRIALVRVMRTTPGGNITTHYGGRCFDANGCELGSASSKLHVRWPTEADRADHRKLLLREAVSSIRWDRRTHEEIEAVAKLLKIEVRDP